MLRPQVQVLPNLILRDPGKVWGFNADCIGFTYIGVILGLYRVYCMSPF